ncbi:MAG: CHAD domain-containing protein [Aeromicrobium sp.]
MTSPTRVLQAADDTPFGLDAIVAALSNQFVLITGARQLVRRAKLDTFDRRLYSAGITLEHQIVSAGGRLVLGQADGSTVTVPAKAVRWPALVAALPAGSVRDTIAPVADIRALIASSDERRRLQLIELHNKDGKTVARVEVDEPASASANGSDSRVTVRTLRGYEPQAQRAVKILMGCGLRAVESSVEPEHKPLLPTAGTHRGEPASVLLTKALTDYLASMRENVPGLLDDIDTEFLHDFRVAVRRTRATLKLGRPSLPEVMRTRWEPAFKWLGDMTTPVRDLDVYELGLPTMASWLVSTNPKELEHFATHLRSRRTAQRRVLIHGLKSAKFRTLMAEWESELAQMVHPSADEDGEHLTAGGLADRGISRAYKRVARDGGAITEESPAEALHDLRKRCKELRYALEVCAPVIAKGPRKHAVANLKGLQDVLGRFQDSEVQRQALHGFAEEMMADGTPASAVLAMGELIGHLDADQERARHEFAGAFAIFAQPSNQQLMHRLGGK